MKEISFKAKSFIFDGVPCEQYGLRLFDINNKADQDGSVITSGEIIEDRLPRLNRPLYYGINRQLPLEFSLVFGTLNRMNRLDLATISAWLVAPQQYKWLQLIQDDLTDVCYRCIITSVKYVSVSDPVALVAHVQCDTWYGYKRLIESVISISGTSIGTEGNSDTAYSYTYNNYSNFGGYYLPRIVFTPGTGVINFKIKNTSDGNREFALTNFPSGSGAITIDCEKYLLTCVGGFNLYNKCNFKFPRFKKGSNVLQFVGDGTVTIENMFPAFVGA